MVNESNPVQRAKAVLGGLNKLAEAAGVTKQSASKWQLVGRIPMAEYAYRVWQATKAMGDEVTMPELAGFDPVAPFPTGTDGHPSRDRYQASPARQHGKHARRLTSTALASIARAA